MQRRQRVMTTTESRRGLDPAVIRPTRAAVASLALMLWRAAATDDGSMQRTFWRTHPLAVVPT